MLGTNFSMSFNIRCMLDRRPFTCIAIITCLTLSIFAYFFKIFEGPVSLVFQEHIEDKINFTYFSNCFWNVFDALSTGKLLK